MNREEKNIRAAEIERQEAAKQLDTLMKERERALQRIRELKIIEDRERALESPARSSVASTSAATALVVTSGHSASALGAPPSLPAAVAAPGHVNPIGQT